MGLFPKIWRSLFGSDEPETKKKGPPRGPYKKKSGADEEARERALYWRDLRINDPAEWRRQMSKRVLPEEKPKDAFSEFLEGAEKYKKLKSAIGDGDKESELVREGMKTAREFAPYIGGLLAPRQQPPMPQAPKHRGEDDEPLAGAAAPSPNPTPEPGVPAAASAPAGDLTPEEHKMIDQLSIMRGILENLNEREAAKVLYGMRERSDNIKAFISRLPDVPDDQVMAAFDRQAAETRAIAPFVQWLHTREEWTVGVCRHLRKLSAPADKPRRKGL